MRPIDELREKIDLWKKSTTDTALMSVLHDVLKQIDVAIYEMDHQEAESPWHRVEEPTKKDGKYLVCWKDGGGFCYDTAWWTSVGTWSLSHWTGVTVTHWMPIEPPKEEEHGN